MAEVPRLMSAEQMVGAWILMTGASPTEKQKTAITNLLVECYESGYRAGKRAAQTEPSEQSDQENYDNVSVTGSGRRVMDGPCCDECGANLEIGTGHYSYCTSYPGEAAQAKTVADEPDSICDGCGVIGGEHRNWCDNWDPDANA